MSILVFLALVIVVLLGLALLYQIGDPEQTTPPRELLTANPQGFVFGEYRRLGQKPQFFYRDEQVDGHILIVGGTGSGKSSGLAIPSLQAWRQRIFAIDIMGELSKATAHKPGQQRVFNPMEVDAWGYDPFYLLRQTDSPVQAALELAMSIIPEVSGHTDPIWAHSPQQLLTAFILHHFLEGLSFVETIDRILKIPVETHITTIAEYTTVPAVQYYITPFVGYVGKDSKMLPSFFNEISRQTLLFVTDDNVKASLSKENVITPDDLENGIDIYLSIPMYLLDQWRPLTRLMVNQFLKHFERRERYNPIPILFLLDELPRLGKIEPVVTGLTTLRSRKITIALIVQSLAQFDLIYGEEQRINIFDNCDYQAILRARDAKAQRVFSEMVGTHEVKRVGSSTSYDNNNEQRGYTTSESSGKECIMEPHEFAKLKEDLVLLSPWGYHRAEKIRPIVS